MNITDFENLLLNFITLRKLADVIEQDFAAHTITVHFTNGSVRTIKIT